MKFLHLADCHLDAPFVELGHAMNKSNMRREELKSTFAKAIQFGKEKDVDVIFISGDLFEHEYVDKSTIQFINDIFSKVSNIKVFISPGNHDPFINNSYYNTFDWCKNVYIFKHKFEKIYLPQLNANIWGVGFNNFHVSKCLVDPVDIHNSDNINVLVTHGTLNSETNEEKYHPLDPDYIYSIGFDYCALGHMHSNFIDESKGICYPGSLEPLGFNELGEHGLILGEITKNYRAVNFHPFALRQYQILEVDVTGAKTTQEIIEDIEFSSKLDFYKEDFVKIKLIGKVETSIVNIELIEEYLKDYFYFLKIQDNTSMLYSFEEIEKEYTLRGLFVKRMNELISKSEKEDEEMLIKALYYGVDALTDGKVRL